MDEGRISLLIVAVFLCIINLISFIFYTLIVGSHPKIITLFFIIQKTKEDAPN